MVQNMEEQVASSGKNKNEWSNGTERQLISPKEKKLVPEFQVYIFMLATEENDKIFGGGMAKDRDVNSYMTIYVRIISGKTLSIKCDRRQTIARILDDVERKTTIQQHVFYLANQGKALSDKKTIEESNIEAGTTIEMSMRLQGGMKKDETMAPVETEEDWKKKVERARWRYDDPFKKARWNE